MSVEPLRHVHCMTAMFAMHAPCKPHGILQDPALCWQCGFCLRFARHTCWCTTWGRKLRVQRTHWQQAYRTPRKRLAARRAARQHRLGRLLVLPNNVNQQTNALTLLNIARCVNEHLTQPGKWACSFRGSENSGKNCSVRAAKTVQTTATMTGPAFLLRVLLLAHVVCPSASATTVFSMVM